MDYEWDSAKATANREMRKEYDFTNGKRGPVVAAPPGKTRITIRLDQDVLEWFKAQVEAVGGGNYQTLINQTLREYMTEAREPLEDTLRRVVREELRHTG
ncbi:MAG: BrnA antitoxin family protein [Gammaproteobacteria bacterium]|nr:BrnA antitoxin family protein [Gammaproteobacteria bacterium]